jgi:hypothetical protein
MVIKASSAAEIRQLIDALTGPDDVRREAAAARLTVIGSRAVERLVAAFDRSTDRVVKLTILRILEPSAEPRALAPARQALQDAGLAIAATQVLRALLDTFDAGIRGDALDALVTVALDDKAERQLRRAAVDALRDMPADIRARVEASLASSASASSAPSAPTETIASGADDGVWARTLQGHLPPRPDALLEVTGANARSAPLPSLQKLVDAVRARESAAGSDAPAWRAVRGTVHQALAQRGSRVALYDLRESFAEASAPLPVSFLAAVNTVGDATCLEALAAAWSHAAPAEGWWRGQLAAAFRAIMAREKLTKRSAVVKKVEKKWPGLVDQRD